MSGCGATGPVIDNESRPRNLLVIVIDTLRQDHLECYGYERTTAPTLCALAGEGVLLDGIAPSSWTKPATASLLTGLHPLRHQAIDRNDLLPQQAETLAEMLSSRGVTSIGLSANGWISTRFGFDQGFASLVSVAGSDGSPATAEQVNAKALPAIEELASPFFLYLHYVDPHEPYDPPIGWDGGSLAPDLAARAPITNADLSMANFITRDPQLLRQTIDLYDGEIRSVDRQIGILLERMRELGLLDHTLTIVASDHGEEFDEHGRAGHGMTLYREVTRVPFIFHSPAVIPGGRHLGTASLLDIAPTALDLLGLDAAEGAILDGGSLANRLIDTQDGSGAEDRLYLLHLDVDGAAVLATVQENLKLVLAAKPYRKELFDLTRDPTEQHNLYEREPIPKDLATRADRLADAYNRIHQQALERDTTDTAGEVADPLRALGYVSPSLDTLRPRQLPHRIRPADAEAGGLVGWERLNDLSSCLAVDDAERAHQLLAGWRYPELEGRWTLPEASLVLARPPATGDLTLRLTGANWREPFQLRVWLGSHLAIDQAVARGGFNLSSRIPGTLTEARHVVMRLESQPPFEPRPPMIGKPHWRLGVFVRTICLEPVGPTADNRVP